MHFRKYYIVLFLYIDYHVLTIEIEVKRNFKNKNTMSGNMLSYITLSNCCKNSNFDYDFPNGW